MKFARLSWLVICLISALVSATSWAVTGDDFDYHSYMRAGIGSSTTGGDQTCYHQANVPGNEFRLGNECGIYGESYFQAYLPHTRTENGEFFRANFDFYYTSAGKNYAEPPGFGIFGAYIEAAHLNGTPETFWVGKRYYRDVDVHMDDFFYFADTSGNGAGIQDIPLFNAKLSLAVMMEDQDVLATGATPPTFPNNSQPRTILFDARLFKINLNDTNHLDIWTGYATSSAATSTAGTAYDSQSGYIGGVKEEYRIKQGYNRVAALYGHGLMEGMNLGGTFGTEYLQLQGVDNQAASYRIRLVDEFVFKPFSQFDVGFGAIADTWSDGVTGDNVGHWYTVGIRPTYYFTDHYSLLAQLGVSNVLQPGVSQSAVPMVRGTLAAQITPKPEYFSRPSLRAFLTDTAGDVGQGTAFGFQGEVWF